MERNHQSDISDLHANQRIEYQRLEDENLNFKRQLGTIDDDVKEARNKLDGATKQLEQIRNENQALRVKFAFIHANQQLRDIHAI